MPEEPDKEEKSSSSSSDSSDDEEMENVEIPEASPLPRFKRRDNEEGAPERPQKKGRLSAMWAPLDLMSIESRIEAAIRAGKRCGNTQIFAVSGQKWEKKRKRNYARHWAPWTRAQAKRYSPIASVKR